MQDSDVNSSTSRYNSEAAAKYAAVKSLLDNAECAATGRGPKYMALIGAWSGIPIEATFKNLHYAEAVLARLYSPEEVEAAIPDAVRRARDALAPDDPTYQRAMNLLQVRSGEVSTMPLVKNRSLRSCPRRKRWSQEDLSEIIAIGHEASDRHRARLRVFRNIVITATVLTTILMVAFVVLSWRYENVVSLCFAADPTPVPPNPTYACPTSEGPVLQLKTGEVAPVTVPKPSKGDGLTVAAMGLIGGALSAAVFVRGLYVNSTPYNVAVPLALLKLPSGAMVAVIGLLLVSGSFVPGFSAIDRQSQILAYAVVFGFAQQLFTKMLDQRAERLLANIPTKARTLGTVPPNREDNSQA